MIRFLLQLFLKQICCFSKNLFGKFQQTKKIKRLILCSGKIYFELQDYIDTLKNEKIHILRIEQLYPFPYNTLEKKIKKFSDCEIVWCQEEPMNQGAWYSSQHHMRKVIHELKATLYLEYAGREASASPAAGYMALHIAQQERFIAEALKLN